VRMVCLLLALWISSAQCRSADVVLNLQKYNNTVVISVINLSKRSVKISRLFTENPGYGLVEFFIYVDGRRSGPLIPPNEPLPISSDYIELSPFDVVGRVFSIPYIRKEYRVGNSCFNLTVEYHDIMAQKFGAYSETVKSNEIYICDQR